MTKVSISLEDWARLNKLTDEQMKLTFDQLTLSNEILDNIPLTTEVQQPSIIDRARRWVAEHLAKLAFTICPEVRDDYY